MDIALTWDERNARGDWSVVNGDLAGGDDLVSAILVSLFTDKRAPDGYVSPVPFQQGTDKRGWWGDTYFGRLFGSWLWLRSRSIKTLATLKLIEGDCRDALAWLVTLGVVASFDVAASWVNKTGVQVVIVAHMPRSADRTFRFGWVWGQVN